jgi:uncharacterized protein with PIN domain
MLYAETSAVLRWLLNQEHAQEVRLELERAESVAASCLTTLECRRVLCRLTHELAPKDNATLRQMLFQASRRWLLVEMDQPVRDRARRGRDVAARLPLTKRCCRPCKRVLSLGRVVRACRTGRLDRRGARGHSLIKPPLRPNVVTASEQR